jgi:large subunit ribosomal protein L32
MPVPKRKTSKARRNSRNANRNVEVKSFFNCQNCSQVALSHQVCQFCGFYKGEKVMETKLDRALRRGTARQKMAAKQATTVEAESAEQAK